MKIKIKKQLLLQDTIFEDRFSAHLIQHALKDTILLEGSKYI